MERVLVTGGRDFALPDEVHRILAPIHAKKGIAVLGHGDAEGLDTLAKLWALSMDIEAKPYEVTQAQWDLYGNRAGNMRNSRMLREFKPTLGVAFPGGNGTGDMLDKLLESGVPTLVSRYINIERSTLRWELRKGRFI
jgi:hypothetical protein